MTYKPDNWVVIKLKGDDPHYRVLAGWSGRYLSGSSWRMNSGITAVEEDDESYYFSGSSGSTYRCGKGSYALRMNNAGIWKQLQELHGDNVELMSEDTDWMNVDWAGHEQDNVKQVVISKLDETLSTNNEYSEQDIQGILTRLGEEARSMGYKDITYSFESTMEPYEDYLGSPILRVNGWIAKTKKDLEEEAAREEQQALAVELGCTYFEAGQYLRLKKKGIIK